MKQKTKIALFAAGAVAAVGLTAGVTALVTAWGDNGGGRPSYTLEEINSGALGDTITLNSISDNPNIGDEKNFVGARLLSDTSKVWNANEIEAVDGETYVIRAYVHNNSPKEYDAVAKDVTVNFDIAQGTGTDVEVQGIVTSSNASPTKYYDSVHFTSDVAFHLEYVAGSALLENNGIGAGGGVALPDAITAGGTLIGYDALDGQVPGCFQFANYVTIEVKVVYDYSYTVDKTVRNMWRVARWFTTPLIQLVSRWRMAPRCLALVLISVATAATLTLSSALRQKSLMIALLAVKTP